MEMEGQKYAPPEGPIAVMPIDNCAHVVEEGGGHVAADGDVTSLFERIRAGEMKVACQECGDERENWLCCGCLTVHCSRHVAAHGKQHFEESGHAVALGFNDLSVWCHRCEAYLDVYNVPAVRCVYREAHVSKFGEPPPGAMFSGPATLILDLSQ